MLLCLIRDCLPGDILVQGFPQAIACRAREDDLLAGILKEVGVVEFSVLFNGLDGDRLCPCLIRFNPLSFIGFQERLGYLD